MYLVNKVRLAGPTALLLSVLALSLSLNVALGWRTARLAPPASQGERRGGIREGRSLLNLALRDSSGAAANLMAQRDNRKLVVYVFAPTCGWCRRDHANIVALATQSAKDYRFVAVATHAVGLPEYLADNPYPFQVLTLPPGTPPAEGFDLTPQIVLADAAGVASKVWTGAIMPAVQPEVERLFGVRLPGLLASPSSTEAK
jgi:hypothetical protein